MTENQQVFTDAQFKSKIRFHFLSLTFMLVLGTVLASGLILSAEFFRGLGKFMQMMFLFFFIKDVVFLVRHRFIRKPGTFSGSCPYCGTANEVVVDYLTQPVGKNCPNCKNRFLVKDGKFYQLDIASQLDVSFLMIKNGISLVRKGIIFFIPCLVLLSLIFLLTLVVAVVAILNPLLGLALTIPLIILTTLLAIISVVVRMVGLWQCLQTPNRLSAKSWITATVWLEGATFVILVSQFWFMNAQWIDFLLKGVIVAGQVTFLIFLEKLCNFLQWGDLEVKFDGLLDTSTTIFVCLYLVEPMIPDSYKVFHMLCLIMFGFGVFSSYLNNLKQLETYLGKAIAIR